MEAGVVRVGIPPRGRDREVVPLSEFNRDFAEDVGGLGRAKYSIDSFFHNITNKSYIFVVKRKKETKYLTRFTSQKRHI